MIKFKKVRDVISPKRNYSTDAGIDFFVPKDFVETKMSVGDAVIIPSGIKIEIPKGHALISFNKSGISLKKGIVCGACVVDYGYTGEVHLHLIKVSGEDVVIKPDDKVLQFVLLKIDDDALIEVDEIYSEGIISDRNNKGFGSSG